MPSSGVWNVAGRSILLIEAHGRKTPARRQRVASGLPRLWDNDEKDLSKSFCSVWASLANFALFGSLPPTLKRYASASPSKFNHHLSVLVFLLAAIAPPRRGFAGCASLWKH